MMVISPNRKHHQHHHVSERTFQLALLKIAANMLFVVHPHRNTTELADTRLQARCDGWCGHRMSAYRA
jgi:hypothetical protein